MQKPSDKGNIIETMSFDQLWLKLIIAGNRPLQDLREKGYKQRIFKKIMLSQYFPAIDVHKICDDLHRKERKAQ